MFEHALIAVDVHSEVHLLNCAPDLRNWGVERLTLLHLIKRGYGEGPLPGLADDYRKTLEESAEKLRATGFEVDVVVDSTPDIGEGIVELSSDFDLVVAGTRSMNLVEEFFLGSVVRKLMRDATVPVLLEWVEASGESDDTAATVKPTESLRHVLLATDLTHGSTAAHDAAMALAARGATVDCVHVMQSDELTDFAEHETMVRAAVNELAERVESAGGKGEAIIVEEGDPVSQLLDLAGERDVSLLVVGRTGRNWPKSMLGSTARKLCEQAALPVLLVPRTGE